MNIEPDIFDYLQTTALEPHDDYTSQITYKDQKIIWNRLKQQEKQLNKQKEVLDKIKEYVKKEISLIDKDLSECELTYSEKYNFENEKNKYINILELLEEIE